MSSLTETAEIGCDCGKFKANLTAFPKNTPGRLACYCNDCRQFLEKIDRTDLLDEFGGTEIVPVYPSEIEFSQGKEHLQCHRLTKKGLHRWKTSCCNSPIANTKVGFPWIGLFHSTYTATDPESLTRLGNIKSRIFGRDAKEGAPFKISNKISFSDFLVVLPFVVKGKILKKQRHSPFFENDGTTPVCTPHVFSQSSE